jgi:hypothetical protein
VLHHLDDPLSGLRSLEARLATGGILRLMIYSRYARRAEESIRRAFRMLGITNAARAKDIIRRSAKGSRLRTFAESSDETGFEAGLADALLHPTVRTYRIDELLELLRQTGLELLQFAHSGALELVDDEIKRIRLLEADRRSCGNFLLYLGHATKKQSRNGGNDHIVLNPCLRSVVSPLRLGTIRLPPRLGFENPPLGWRERSFLHTFRNPVAWCMLGPEVLAAVNSYKKSLFLLQY